MLKLEAMKNPEYEKAQDKSQEEFGFSEKELDIDIEIKAGEWQNLKKFKTYQRRTRQWKIIATYKAISNRLNQLVSMYYSLVRDNPKQGEKMLKELKKLRMLQEILLQCMAWSYKAGSPQKEITKEMVPQEVWEMIR